jgi:hypothetical protein
VVRGNPCPRGGACRVRDCAYGHLCQREGCEGGGGGGGAGDGGQKKGGKCRMGRHLHGVDPVLASMVPVEEEDDHDGLGNGGGDEGGGLWY